MTLLAQWRRADAPNLSQNAFDTLLKLLNRIVHDDAFKPSDLPKSFYDIDKHEQALDLIVPFCRVCLSIKLIASVRTFTKPLFLAVIFISMTLSNAFNSFWRVPWRQRCFPDTAPRITAEHIYGMAKPGKNKKQEFTRITLVYYRIYLDFSCNFFLTSD